jgi:hypothetical protein
MKRVITEGIAKGKSCLNLLLLLNKMNNVMARACNKDILCKIFWFVLDDISADTRRDLDSNNPHDQLSIAVTTLSRVCLRWYEVLHQPTVQSLLAKTFFSKHLTTRVYCKLHRPLIDDMYRKVTPMPITETLFVDRDYRQVKQQIDENLENHRLTEEEFRAELAREAQHTTNSTVAAMALPNNLDEYIKLRDFDNDKFKTTVNNITDLTTFQLPAEEFAALMDNMRDDDSEIQGKFPFPPYTDVVYGKSLLYTGEYYYVHQEHLIFDLKKYSQ